MYICVCGYMVLLPLAKIHSPYFRQVRFITVNFTSTENVHMNFNGICHRHIHYHKVDIIRNLRHDNINKKISISFKLFIYNIFSCVSYNVLQKLKGRRLLLFSKCCQTFSKLFKKGRVKWTRTLVFMIRNNFAIILCTFKNKMMILYLTFLCIVSVCIYGVLRYLSLIAILIPDHSKGPDQRTLR